MKLISDWLTGHQGESFNLMSGLGSGSGQGSMVTSPVSQQNAVTSGVRSESASHVIKRHKCDGVRRMVAHPHLPLYITGGQDGAVAIWEWSHSSQVNITLINKILIYLYDKSNV